MRWPSRLGRGRRDEIQLDDQLAVLLVERGRRLRRPRHRLSQHLSLPGLLQPETSPARARGPLDGLGPPAHTPGHITNSGL